METIAQSTRDWLDAQLATDFQIEKHNYSNQDDVYKIRTSEKNFYLKIASALQTERQNLLKIQPYIQVPHVISFGRITDRDHLLLSEIPGNNLAELIEERSNIEIIRVFADAIRKFHSLDIDKLFPGSPPGLVVTHGDMALPNIIWSKSNSIGYIDLGKMSVGSPDIDLADAIWSLQRNIGPDYGKVFLEEYGNVVMTKRLDEALKFRYSP